MSELIENMQIGKNPITLNGGIEQNTRNVKSSQSNIAYWLLGFLTSHILRRLQQTHLHVNAEQSHNIPDLAVDLSTQHGFNETTLRGQVEWFPKCSSIWQAGLSLTIWSARLGENWCGRAVVLIQKGGVGN